MKLCIGALILILGCTGDRAEDSGDGGRDGSADSRPGDGSRDSQGDDATGDAATDAVLPGPMGYGPCPSGGRCPGGAMCLPPISGRDACAPLCPGGVGDCPDPGEGSATPQCLPVDDGLGMGTQVRVCILTCSVGSDECPFDGACVNAGGGVGSCVWVGDCDGDICSGTCTDLDTDESNCGTCAKDCAPGEVCVGGDCGCPTSLPDVCVDQCVDTDTDESHCGSCGNACETFGSCNSGTCECPSTRPEVCGTTCVDTDDSRSHCGSCGNACATGAGCNGGTCECDGGATFTVCGDVCVDKSTSLDHCGACDNHCGIECALGVCLDPVHVAIGTGHRCAALSDGTVRCWGTGSRGEIGDGANDSRTTPTAASGITGAIQVAAGGYHTDPGHSCALHGGQVSCWGRNDFGQLGTGTTDDSNTPVLISGLSNVAQIHAGSYHTCSVSTTATVRCWGRNDNGQLGDGTMTEAHAPTATIAITEVVQIACGNTHTCALRSNQTMRCWGSGSNGQLGTGGGSGSLTPDVDPGLTAVTAMSVGQTHTCATAGGVSYCFGYNVTDQTGVGSAGGSAVLVPTVIDSTVAMAQFGLGRFHTCARDSAGQVYCWGSGGAGASPVVTSITDAAQLATGSRANCVIKTNNELWCWTQSALTASAIAW